MALRVVFSCQSPVEKRTSYITVVVVWEAGRLLYLHCPGLRLEEPKGPESPSSSRGSHVASTDHLWPLKYGGENTRSSEIMYSLAVFKSLDAP